MDNVTLEQKVIAIIDQIRPYLQQDGGDLEFVKMEGKVVTLPAREDIDLPVEEHLIVELYSK